MFRGRNFVYDDEQVIEDDFKCPICQEPFEKATCTPCDHTFCQVCIEKWLEGTDQRNRACPICRFPLSSKTILKLANRIIINHLDKYRVKCLICNDGGIPRGSFSNHLQHQCRKVIKKCSAEDILCPWIGLNEELDQHLLECPFQKVRPVVENLLRKIDLLEKRVNQQDQQILMLSTNSQQQKHSTNQAIEYFHSPSGKF